jgi:hypothetical protein
MSAVQNRLGFNLTNHDPINDSPFGSSTDEGSGLPPPATFRMITELGIYMITETTLDDMITE